MKKFLRRLAGQNPWKKEWQDELSATLQEAQKNLSVSMVVAIAVESDFYAEVLFILSFIGLALGVLAGYIFQAYVANPADFLLFPIGGFAIGASFFQFRHFYLHHLAPKAVRDRVALRAKALFFDHSQNLKGRLALLYFSELEREVLLVTTPELMKEIPSDEPQRLLTKLIKDYSSARPLKSLRPCLLELGSLFRRHLVSGDGSEMPTEMRVPIYIGATDKTEYLKVPILKGSKDIN